MLWGAGDSPGALLRAVRCEAGVRVWVAGQGAGAGLGLGCLSSSVRVCALAGRLGSARVGNSPSSSDLPLPLPLDALDVSLFLVSA